MMSSGSGCGAAGSLTSLDVSCGSVFVFVFWVFRTNFEKWPRGNGKKYAVETFKKFINPETRN